MNDCQIRGHRKLFITCEDCHQVINQATFKATNEWISVKDRMPKIDEFPRNEVITWDGNGASVLIPCFLNDGTCEFFTCGFPVITH